ncbi:MAG TPA: Gfo/Idh/MocA family oxidoreductase [Planctomycetota bacterium]|nr:Gfo/Idh/MocA family oxidoreductase [Planctomycetota bacterium]
MPAMHRRSFLKRSAAAGVGLVAASEYARAVGSNDRLRIAVLGVNGRGKSHVSAYSGMKDVEVSVIVDPDLRVVGVPVKEAESRQGKAPATLQDLRKMLEDKSVDAVSIATPNHWHSLATIWSCEAGKDVYVEKPCSHNVWEGRRAVETARRHRRIVQHGTQSRSSSDVRGAIEQVRAGKIGKVLVARGLCYKPRESIGVRQPEAPPQELDFNVWLGPAREQPYHGNLVHYNWHWMWDTGNGDIGNQGVHEMDVARWGLGAGLPKAVASFGGRFGYQDQGQTANTQVVLFDYGDAQLIFEVRGLPTRELLGVKIGNIFHGTEGTLVVGRGIYRKGSSRPEPIPPSTQGGDHFRNFIDAARSRKTEDLRADILDGHLSSALCHLANISYRLGSDEPFHGRLGDLSVDAATREALGRTEEHLAMQGVKLEEQTLRVGRRLVVDPEKEKFVDSNDANALLTREYRKPFVPEGAVATTAR